MHPLLIELGPIPIHTYGFLIAIGFLVAVYTIRKLSLRSSLDEEKVLDLTFWMLLVGFLGARVLFIITRLDFFLSEPVEMFKIWEGGLVFFGGPIVCVPFMAWYVRRYALPAWRTADAMIPGLVIAHMFGRFGCLAAGCCYGRPTGTDFGVRLHSELVETNLQGIPLHPTQLYEAVALGVLFWGLLQVFKRKRFDGQVVLTYFIAYPIIRSIVEIFRGDIVRGFVIEGILSTSQFISILAFAAATWLMWKRLQLLNGPKLKVVAGPDEKKPESEQSVEQSSDKTTTTNVVSDT